MSQHNRTLASTSAGTPVFPSQEYHTRALPIPTILDEADDNTCRCKKIATVVNAICSKFTIAMEVNDPACVWMVSQRMKSQNITS